jgi:hypothetical protein
VAWRRRPRAPAGSVPAMRFARPSVPTHLACVHRRRWSERPRSEGPAPVISPGAAAARPAAACLGLALSLSLCLAGCGQPDPAAGRGEPAPGASAIGGGSGSPGTSGTPEASGPAVAPLGACGDGRCLVRVRASTRIPVPSRSLVRDVRVDSVTAGRVTLSGSGTGSRQSSQCFGECDASSTNGRFRVSLGTGGTAGQNRLRITVVSSDGGSAVLRLEMA